MTGSSDVRWGVNGGSSPYIFDRKDMKTLDDLKRKKHSAGNFGGRFGGKVW